VPRLDREETRASDSAALQLSDEGASAPIEVTDGEAHG
jgi:hypothetical protein